jgi:Na+(H+)/acetate symporter ActP
MLNAVASIITADLFLITANVTQRQLSLTARVVTIGVAAGAICIGAQGYSVLELFLLADLLAAATVVPFLSGLFSTRITEYGAITASVLGLIIGITYFPITRSILEHAPLVGGTLPSPSFFVAFVGAAVVSSGVTFLAARISNQQFDHETLAREIKSLSGSESQRTNPSSEEGLE